MAQIGHVQIVAKEMSSKATALLRQPAIDAIGSEVTYTVEVETVCAPS